MLLKSELACRELPSVVVAYGKWLLASTLRGKTGFGTFGELFANKSLSAVLELMKINLIVVIPIIYFYPYVKQRCVLLSFKKLKTITSDDKHMNIHIFINSRTIIIYRGVYEERVQSELTSSSPRFLFATFEIFTLFFINASYFLSWALGLVFGHDR